MIENSQKWFSIFAKELITLGLKGFLFPRYQKIHLLFTFQKRNAFRLPNNSRNNCKIPSYPEHALHSSLLKKKKVIIFCSFVSLCAIPLSDDI